MDNGPASSNRSRMIEIVLNGAPYAIASGTSVEGLVQALGLARARLAVERNMEIVPRSAYVSVRLEPGDRVEIVNFVGGG